MGDIGEHCSVCRRQDYLPFYCEDCKKYFCREHRGHGCPNAGDTNVLSVAEAKTRRASISKTQCAHRACSRHGSAVDFHCKACGKTFCVNHRARSAHQCPGNGGRELYIDTRSELNASDDTRIDIRPDEDDESDLIHEEVIRDLESLDSEEGSCINCKFAWILSAVLGGLFILILV